MFSVSLLHLFLDFKRLAALQVHVDLLCACAAANGFAVHGNGFVKLALLRVNLALLCIGLVNVEEKEKENNQITARNYKVTPCATAGTACFSFCFLYFTTKYQAALEDGGIKSNPIAISLGLCRMMHNAPPRILGQVPRPCQ